MRRYKIQLHALRAFEAAARLSSFSQAGVELNVSHSTISHHIKGLEQSLGVELFLRKNRTVTLTPAAEPLYQVLHQSFDEIANALNVVSTTAQVGPLNVTVTPSFANKWLIPNLRLFRESHPEIEVQVKPSLQLDDFALEGLDVGVRTGPGNWPGLSAKHLMSVHMTPVCSPEYLKNHGGKIGLADLRYVTQVHADVAPGTGIESEWSEWLASVGAPNSVSEKRLSVQDPGLALQAAKDGIGIAMGYMELAAIDLERGLLVQLFPDHVIHPWSYYIVTPEDKRDDWRSRIFCNWLSSVAQSA